MSHTRIRCREKVDSRLLVVGSQTAGLTPGPSFAHNLGYRCPNGQSKPFSISTFQDLSNDTKYTPNARCFGPCYRALNIRESRRTPNPNFSKCWDSPPTLGQSRVATKKKSPPTPSFEIVGLLRFPLVPQTTLVARLASFGPTSM